jgi:hypothetical protein
MWVPVSPSSPRLKSGPNDYPPSEFAHILKSLLFLLKRLRDDLWKGEGPEFAQVVFDAIKDNPSYIKLIEEVDPSDEKPWFLSWFGEYLWSLKDSGVFGDVLAKVVDLLCEELQHERFKEVRPTVMFAAIRVSFHMRDMSYNLSPHLPLVALVTRTQSSDRGSIPPSFSHIKRLRHSCQRLHIRCFQSAIRRWEVEVSP